MKPLTLALAFCQTFVLACPSHNVSDAAKARPNVSRATPLGAGTTAPPPWVAEARRLFLDSATQQAEHAADSFVRARFELPSLSPSWSAEHCSTPASCRERSLYVRVHRTASEVEFLPHCSASDPERLLDELTAAGPWALVSGELQAKQTLTLRNAKRQQLKVHLEVLRLPQTTRNDTWDDWRYVRAIGTAYAASAGFSVLLLGRDQCDAGVNTAVCEAQLATQGNPLTPLRGLQACSLWPSPKDCVRDQVLGQVAIGSFQSFCGRVAPVPLPSQPTPAEISIAVHRRKELEAWGIDVQRVLQGAAWTARGHRVPQVNIAELAALIALVDLKAPLQSRLSTLAADTTLAWDNRLRARLVLLYLDHSPTEDELLAEFHHVLALASTGAEANRMDLQCVEYLSGALDWLCAHG